jgi:hypothetical protein
MAGYPWSLPDEQGNHDTMTSVTTVRQPRRYEPEVPADSEAVEEMEVEVRYHLLVESRRKRIGYQNRTLIDYALYRQQIPLAIGKDGMADE